MSNKIKCVGNSVDTNEVFLHPVTLELVLNKGPKKICPTELHYVNGKAYTAKPLTPAEIVLTDRDIQNYMAIPYLNLNMEQMLSIYKIESIDTLIKWLDNNIDKPIQTINRVLMVWIRFNFEELKENNRVLVNIYKRISKKINYEHINVDDLENKINNWFKKNNPDSFHLNLTEYLYK